MDPKEKMKLWKRVLFILLFLYVSSTCAEDKCVEDNAGQPVFRYMSNEWTDEAANNLSACSHLCAYTRTKREEPVKFGGFQEGYCLCAVGGDADDCNPAEEAAKWGDTSIATRASPLDEDDAAIKVTKFTCEEKEPQEVSCEVEFQPENEYLLDYGDGSATCATKNHFYATPGSYDVMLIVNPNEDNEVVQYTTVNVTEAGGEGSNDGSGGSQSGKSDGLLVNCTEKVEFEEPLICSVTVTKGRDLRLKVTITKENENVKSFVEDLPDVPVVFVGPEIPQSKECAKEKKCPVESGQWVALTDDPISYDGYVTGVELYALEDSEIEIKIMKPDGENKCCQEGDEAVFSSAMPFCDKPDSAKSVSLETVSGDGYVKKPLEGDQRVQVSSGDIIAFKYNKGSLNSRDLSDCEAGDHYVDNAKKLDCRHMLRLTISTPIELSFEEVFSDTGNFTVGIQVASMEDSVQVAVAVNLTELTLKPESEFGKTGESFMFTASVKTGSDVDIKWIINDEETDETHEKGVVSDKPMNWTHKFETQGVYKVAAIVSNALGNLEENVTIEIQDELKDGDWEFVSDDSTTIPEGKINFNLTYKGKPPTPLGTKYEVDWGDGEKTEGEYNDESPNPIEGTHQYTKDGNYSVKFKVYNDVSKVNKTKELMLTEKIKISFGDVTVQEEEGSDKFRELYGKYKNITVKQRVVRLKLDCSKDVTHIHVDWGNGTYVVYNPDDVLENFYNESGDFDIKVYGSNAVEEKGHEVTFSLSIQDFLGMGSISDFGITTDMDQTKTFEINYGSDQMCVNIDYGDGTEEKYGPKDVCDSNFTNSKYIGVPESLPFNVSHIYTSRNYYVVAVTVFDAVRGETTTLFILVNKFPYSPNPSIYIRVNSTDYRKPIPYICSKGYKIETQALLPHLSRGDLYNVINYWNVIAINPNTGEELLDQGNPLLNNCPKASVMKSSLFIQPRCLKYGIYKVISYYNVSTNQMDPLYPFILTDFTYLNVTKGELHAALTNSNQVAFVIGYGQTMNLTGQQSSIDPDDPDNKEFNMTWHCRKLGESISESDGIQDIPEPKEADSHEDEGGCFGRGPGFINVPNGVWELNSQSFYKAEVIYVIWLRIQKDTRNSSAYALVKVVPFMVPVLALKCTNSALCSRVNDGMSINGVTRLSMTVSCVEHCHNIKSYEWDVRDFHSDDDPDGSEIDGAKDFIIGNGEPLVAVTLDFFRKHSNIDTIAVYATAVEEVEEAPMLQGEGGQHTIEKREAVQIRKEAFIAMRFLINKPPTNGSCDVLAKGARALFDVTIIECVNWIDPEGVGVDTYKIYRLFLLGIDDENRTNILVTSTSTKFAVILKPGVLQLWADISDTFGAKTSYRIDDVEIGMIEFEDMEDFIDDKELDYLKCTGNQFQYMQSMQAWSAVAKELFEKRPPSDDRAAEVSQVITDNIMRLSDVNMDTFEDTELIANSAGTLVGEGAYLDRTGKNVALNLLEDMFDHLNSPSNLITFITPVQATNLFTSSFSILGGVTNSIASTVVHEKVSANDMKNADNIEYDTSLDLDPNFQVSTSVDDARKRNVQEDAMKQSKQHAEKIRGIAVDAVYSVLSNFVPGENAIALETESGVSTYFISARGNDSESLNNAVGGANFKLPSFCKLINNSTNGTDDEEGCDTTLPLGVAVLTWPTLTDVYTKTFSSLAKNTKVVEIMTYSGALASDQPMAVTNASEPITIVIPRKPMENNDNSSNSSAPEEVYPKMKWFEFFMYHQVKVEQHDSSLNINFSTDAIDNIYVIVLRYDKKPTLGLYDLRWVVDFASDPEGGGSYTDFITSKAIRNQVGNFYFGVTQVSDNVTADMLIGENLTRSMVNRNWSEPYTFSVMTSSCLYFDEQHAEWTSKGCMVVSADELSTTCECNHLTSFGSGLVVPPNPIDFSYVFANASFTDNLTIYITIILTLVIFLIFLIWARRKDKKDLEKLGALPLPDNNEEDKYIYEVLVFTSDIKGASCDSQISFILSGDKDETDIRSFGHPPRKVFRKNGVDVFVMAVPRPLGQMQFLRIWHDNSGKGDFASWYMNYIIFHDVQTGEKFEFIGDTWFALEKGDGQIDRIIPVADKEKLTEFGHLFHTTSRKNLTDNHLWFSVFLRPPRSRFTRCQRVCSCMAILYLSMLVNAMWYGTMPEKPSHGFSLGPFNLTPEQISVGFFSNIIIFPPTFLILFLFRKSRPRKLRPSRINQAIKSKKKDEGPVNSRSLLNTPQSQDPAAKGDEGGADQAKPALKYQRKKRFTLPWWCTIIGWFLCISCILLSIFFLWAYGIQFGNEKTKKWVTSLVVSVFTSILITQPIKVFLMAMLFSALCKKAETDQDDADEDEEDPQLDYDEQWLQNGADPTRPRKVAYKMADSEEVARAREIRMKESKMWSILKEIFAYMFFLWILSVIGFGMRDHNAILMFNTLRDNFLQTRSDTGYLNLQTINDYWDWANGRLLNNLRVGRDYTDAPPYGMKGFLSDRVNRIMGYAIMRQIRSKPNHNCVPPAVMRSVVNCSGAHTSMLQEDKNSYGPYWTLPPPNEISSSVERAFTYRRARSLDGYPVLGTLKMYGGGGYVYDLKASTDEIQTDFQLLRNSSWIDKYSKALFVEFSVYNAQVNLFGVVEIFLEFGPAGSLIPDYNIEAIQLMPHESGAGMFVFICEIIYVIFILFYTFTELRNMCKLGREYFRQFSSLAEWALIILSYAAITFYILRHFAVLKVLKRFKETRGNDYINLQKCQYLNRCFTYLLSLIIFLAILKFIKLLRFNKRMSVLSDTLKQCASDLWGFGLVILIVLAAFTQLFYLTFSDTNIDYSTWISTLETLVSVTLNKFEFDMYTNSSSPMMGPVLFFAFSFLMSIVLVNLFLTIVIKSFESVKHDIAKQSNDYEIVDFLCGRVKGLFGMGRDKKRSPPLTLPPIVTEDRPAPTTEFPEKVDRLLQYINKVYFDGKMDLNSKDMMMYRRKKFLHSGDAPHIFNSDM